MAKTPPIAARPVIDPENLQPHDTAEFMERGWLFYSRQKYDSAEADFRFVLQRASNDIEALFALGLTLKAMKKTQQALETFGRIDAELDRLEDRQRAVMIGRLTHGHINQLKTGEWNLEKEVWKSKS